MMTRFGPTTISSTSPRSRSRVEEQRQRMIEDLGSVLDGELLEGTHDWSALEPQLADAL